MGREGRGGIESSDINLLLLHCVQAELETQPKVEKTLVMSRMASHGEFSCKSLKGFSFGG